LNGCSILIGHVDTLNYLKFGVEQIRKYRHPEIPQEIIIVDQSPEAVFEEVRALYGTDDDIRLLRTAAVDLGYVIDVGLRHSRFDFCCTLDCDAFPIHRNWLYLPIRLLEKHNIAFVGSNTGLEKSYQQKGQFFHLNNYYRVSRTALARQLSETVGFIRPGKRNAVGFQPKDTSWGTDYADVGVIAQWYADQKQLGDKLSLKITSYIGKTNKMGVYGMVIDDLVFHMVFGGKEEVNETFGPAFLQLREKMLREGLAEPFIRELIAGSVKAGSSRSLNGQPLDPEIDRFIEQLKNS
jgi:hypothetical protein